MRLVLVLAVLGVLFIGFAGMTLFDGGKLRDVVESFIPGVLMLGGAFLMGRRYLPSKMRPRSRV